MVQGNETARRLAEDDKQGKVPTELYNHYTVIQYQAETGEYTHIANAVYFQQEIAAIVSALADWISGMPSNSPVEQDIFSPRTHASKSRTILSRLCNFIGIETGCDSIDDVWMASVRLDYLLQQ